MGTSLANKKIMSMREFMPVAFQLSLPIMLQNLISSLVNTADTVMLGYVNQTAMSASSLANQYTFLLFCFYYGIATGTSVLCAQYWGKGDAKTVERVVGLAERLTIIVSLVFFAVSFLFPREIMTIFTNSAPTIEAGSGYLRVLSFSFLFMGFSQMYVSALRSVGKVVFPSVVYVVSLFVNIACNASFIFGLFGLPRLGVVGVALGTVIARIVEVVLCLGYSAVTNSVKFRVKYLFTKAGILLSDFLKISVPSLGNDVVWGLAASCFAVILGHIGDDMVAANSVAVMVVNIGAIAARGFASATTVVVSQALGANNIEGAKVYGGRMLWLTIAVSLVGCVVIVAIRPLMVHFYADKLTATALEYLKVILLMNLWRFMGEGINTCLICGCFRGGGDAKFGFYMDIFFMWCVALPIMAAAAYVFKLSPVWVYCAMTLDELEKMPVVLIHYKKYKWLKNITRDESELG